MNQLSSLSDAKLLAQTENLVREERRLTLEVLKHFEEIEARQLFARHGYSSLLEMCIKKFAYSESAAVRRIDGMRLLKKIPQIEKKIELGQVRLSQLAQVQSFLRAEKKDAGRTYSSTQTLDLVEQIQGRSTRDTDRWLLEKSPALKLRREIARGPSPLGYAQSQLVIDDELANLLAETRTLTAQDTDYNPATAALIKKSLHLLIRTRRAEGSSPSGMKTAPPPATNTSPVLRTRNARTAKDAQKVPPSVRKMVFVRAKGRCEYQSPVDGQRCTSRFALELHQHAEPAGENAPSAQELSVYCKTHFTAHKRWNLSPRTG